MSYTEATAHKYNIQSTLRPELQHQETLKKMRIRVNRESPFVAMQ